MVSLVTEETKRTSARRVHGSSAENTTNGP